MFSSTEKTVRQAPAVQQRAAAPAFFKKAGDQESFFGPKQPPSFFGSPVQPKLTVSSPDDPQEREADAVADKVMRMPEPVAAAPATANEKEEKIDRREEEVQPTAEAPLADKIQGKQEREQLQAKACSCGGQDDHTHIHTRQDTFSGSIRPDQGVSLFPSDVMRQSGRGPPADSIPFEQTLASSKGGGSALPSDTRQFMESRMGADFSGVRIHTGVAAEGMSRSVNAQAFAHGSDIYFNSGKYSPDTADGRTLLAHELTHTMQQGAGVHRRAYLQLKLDNFSKSEHGANSTNRLKSQVDQQSTRSVDSQNNRQQPTRNEIQSQKNSKKRQLKPLGTPEINESRIQIPKAAEAKKRTAQKVDNPQKAHKKSLPNKLTLQHKGSSKKEHLQSRSKTANARAHSAVRTPKPVIVQPVQIFVPKDAAGKELSVDQQHFSGYAEMAAGIQQIRNQGHELVEHGNIHEQQSYLTEGQIHAAESIVEESDNNLGLIDQGIEARKQAHQQGITALQTAETKQQTVEASLPQHMETLTTSKRDSGEAVTESQSLHSESASKQPEDPEDRANAQEMGGHIGKVAEDSSSIDQTFSQGQQHTQTLAERTAEAKNKNAASSAALQQISQKIAQTTTKSLQLKEANQQARAEINNHSNEPAEVRAQAIEIKQQGTLMIANSFALERRLVNARQRFQQNLAKVPPVYDPPQHAENEGKIIQRQAEPGDYGNRRNIFENTALDPRTHQSQEERRRAQEEATASDAAELNYIRNALPGDFNRYSAWTRIRVGIGAKLNRFWGWMSNLGVAGVLGGAGHLLISMFNPMTYIHGVVGGLTQVVNGVVNLAVDIYHGNFWGIVKSLADIATGIAVIAGTITGLALAVEVAMAALLIISAIFTLGASAGFILPVMLFAGKVMVVAGKIAFWAGAAAAALNLVAGIKSLVDMGNAESAEKLQAETNDFTQDMGGVATGLMNMVVGRAGMQGPARMASAANYAITVSEVATTSGSAAAARVVGSSIATSIANAGRGVLSSLTLKGARSRLGKLIRGADKVIEVNTGAGSVSIRTAKLDWLLNRVRHSEDALIGLSDQEITNLAKSNVRSSVLRKVGITNRQQLTQLITEIFEHGNQVGQAIPGQYGTSISKTLQRGGENFRASFLTRPGSTIPECTTMTVPESKTALKAEIDRLFALRRRQRGDVAGWVPPPPQSDGSSENTEDNNE